MWNCMGLIVREAVNEGRRRIMRRGVRELGTWERKEIRERGDDGTLEN